MTYTGTVVTRDPDLIDTIDTLPEGYSGYLRVDHDPESPREWGGNVAVIVQENNRRGDVDKPDDLLETARDRWGWTRHNSLVGAHRSDRAVKAVGQEGMIARYLSIFRPDIAHYVHYWSAGRDLYGWGYVLTEGYEAAGFTASPKEVFDGEVDIYQQWADGEVYGVTVVHDESGKDASLWGVYDTPGYIEEVCSELIEEIGA